MPVFLRQRALYSPRVGLIQPGYPVEVNPNHRLAVGLIGAYLPWMTGAGSTGTGNGWPPAAHDLSYTGGDLGNQGANGMTYSPIGLAWQATHVAGTSDGWQGILSAKQRPATAVSLFTRFLNTSTAGVSSFPTIFGAVYTVANNTAPYDTWDFARASTANNAQFAWNVGGTQQVIALTGLLGTVNEVMNLGATLTADGGTNDASVYKNGAVLAQATPASGSIGYASDSNLVLNGKSGTTGDTGCQVTCAYAWNRALSADEMSELNLEPYGFFRPLARRRFLVVTAAVRTGNMFFCGR